MEYEYDIFEVLHDGSVLWQASARGAKAGLATLEHFSKKTTNECFAIDLSTRTILARVKHASEAGKAQDRQDLKDPIRPASRAAAD